MCGGGCNDNNLDDEDDSEDDDNKSGSGSGNTNESPVMMLKLAPAQGELSLCCKIPHSIPCSSSFCIQSNPPAVFSSRPQQRVPDIRCFSGLRFVGPNCGGRSVLCFQSGRVRLLSLSNPSYTMRNCKLKNSCFFFVLLVVL